MKQSLNSVLHQIDVLAINFDKGLIKKVEVQNRSYGLAYDAQDAEKGLQVFKNQLASRFGTNENKNFVYSKFMALANQLQNLPK